MSSPGVEILPIVSLGAIAPFGLLLLTIALAPLLHRGWWERSYRWVAGGLGLVTVVYYLAGLHDPARVVETGRDYLGFIVLIGALFVVTGGIRVTVPEGTATPFSNVLFLAAGAGLANLIGTTGAAMLLIRPWMGLNRNRLQPYHIVFFIFVVANLGGCLTPVGDPPLFIGYLKGVPFFWTGTHLAAVWAVGVGAVLAIFAVIDGIAFRRLPSPAGKAAGSPLAGWAVSGGFNFALLAAILGAIFLPPLWRVGVMAAAALLSLRLTPRAIHAANDFSFHPIEEVAWLFAGIFATMMPALDLLQTQAGGLGIDTPGKFYWITGGLSALLDNAPTYLTFLTAALGLHGLSIDRPAEVLTALATQGRTVAAISAGAVFFGAMTYIGNGPNFMVRTIAERAGVRVPGFFGYLFRYAVPVLLPVLFVVYWIFFR